MGSILHDRSMFRLFILCANMENIRNTLNDDQIVESTDSRPMHCYLFWKDDAGSVPNCTTNPERPGTSPAFFIAREPPDLARFRGCAS